MNLFGTTRSRVAANHALIAPDSFVRCPLPGWSDAECVVVISPHLGARFTQYLALMNAGGVAQPPADGVERVLYVLDGDVALSTPDAPDQRLARGGFAFLPPGSPVRLAARSPARLNVFEKRYVPRAGVPKPEMIVGHESQIEAAPFMGDPDAMLKVLLPTDPSFDLAVNLFTFRPGAALPLVEIHVMEHGLLMVEGQGVYRLGDGWYPVQAGDVIWMASYCPQWFVAMGKTPAAYLYYKDVNRDPLEAS